jgi:HAD superfamily hydrolase (TIGR01484 family)
MKKEGWIALDIDGTITVDKYSVPDAVTSYLRQKSFEGWKIAIATGRSFQFAAMALASFDFPYILLPQNGSAAIEMPSKKILFTRYLSWEEMPMIEMAFEGIESDFIVYTGVERGDLCYFRKRFFEKEGSAEIEGWKARQKEHWEPIEDFTKELLPSFALAKSFGSFEEMRKVAKRLKERGRFQVSLIRDPFDHECAILLINQAHASKGLSLEEVFRRRGRGSLVIAAGDDENDLSLLGVADVKIAMPHAPDVLKEIADLIAPPTETMGILDALEKACHGRERA